jgi:hypothetical protein
MALTHIYTYLVHPREYPQDQIGGSPVPLEGQLYDLLNDVYEKSDSECDVDVAFNPNAEGAQENLVRDLVMGYLRNPILEEGRRVAHALKTVTTKRSGIGLLFLISGNEDGEHKVVISRFPADNGILAEEQQHGLNVEFLEKVFLKSQYSYKAAVYRGRSLAAGFWRGKVIDKQIGNPVVRVSDYWIKGFLNSDFSTTSAQGTRRLAVALRDAARTEQNPDVRRELTAVATLAGGLAGQRTSIEDFQQRFGLSDDARNAITRALRNPETAGDQFVFSAEAFSREVAYRSVELNSGAILTAQASRFDEVFEQEEMGGGRVRFSTTGTVEGERLKKAAS